MSVEERVLRLQKCTLAGDRAEELNAMRSLSRGCHAGQANA